VETRCYRVFGRREIRYLSTYRRTEATFQYRWMDRQILISFQRSETDASRRYLSPSERRTDTTFRRARSDGRYLPFRERCDWKIHVCSRASEDCIRSNFLFVSLILFFLVFVSSFHFRFFGFWFLVACYATYKRSRPSVWLSVGLSDGYQLAITSRLIATAPRTRRAVYTALFFSW